MNKGNEEAVRQHFKGQAKHFADKSLTLNNPDYLQWIVGSLRLHKEMDVLDVAAGTGILSRGLSPFVGKVTSVDLSEDMIREGLEQLRLNGISNVEYKQGHVEHLPVEAEQFDLVVSRLAFHHFANPGKVMEEMIRVCKKDGQLCVVDMISPEDASLYRAYNHYERLRDPSHTEALSQSQWLSLYKEAGLEVNVVETIDVPVHVGKWLHMTKTDEVTSKLIVDVLLEEIDADVLSTGLFPFLDEKGTLMFRQRWIKLIADRQR